MRFVTLMLLPNAHPSHICVSGNIACVLATYTCSKLLIVQAVLLYSHTRLTLIEGQGAKRLKLNF